MSEKINRQKYVESVHKEYQFVYGILTGITLVFIAVWIGSTIFSDTESYLTNVFTEIISVIATIFVIDRINQWRSDQQLKNNFLNDLRSPILSNSVTALEQLRRNEWLSDNHFDGENFQRINWEGAYIGGLKFKNTNLYEANLKRVINLVGHKSDPVIFEEVHLAGANLENATLTRCKWINTSMSDANLSGANLSQNYFKNVDLIDAKLENTILQHSSFDKVIFLETNLRGADLRYSRIEKSRIFDSNLAGANLRGIKINKGHIARSSLVGADLRDAKFENVTWYFSKEGTTRLPDGKMWLHDDLERFTNPQHPEFKETLKVINILREELGFEAIRH